MSCKVCNNKNCNCQVFHKETLDRVKKRLPSDDNINKISELLKVVACRTRMKMILALKDEELCVCDIGNLVGITKSAVSHQMRTLRKHNIVKSRNDGKMVYYSLDDSFSFDVIDKVNKYIGG